MPAAIAPAVPLIDEGLCLEAGNRASGATTHNVNNLLHVYRLSLQLAAACIETGATAKAAAAVERAAWAEFQLRIFVARQRQSAALPVIQR